MLPHHCRARKSVLFDVPSPPGVRRRRRRPHPCPSRTPWRGQGRGSERAARRPSWGGVPEDQEVSWTWTARRRKTRKRCRAVLVREAKEAMWTSRSPVESRLARLQVRFTFFFLEQGWLTV